MDIGRTEGKPMVSPLPTAPDKAEQKLPMAHKKPSLSRRIQVGLAKIGLVTAVATGGAGAVHHATGIDVVPPIGATADVIESSAVAGITKLANSEPQQKQDELTQALKDAQNSFKPDSASVDGQVQINFADLSHALTITKLAEIRSGNPHNEFNLETITAVDNNPAEPGSLIVIDSPEEVNIPGVGLGKFYTFSINTPGGDEPVILPEAFARVTKPGDLVKLSTLENDAIAKFNQVHVINPAP